MQDYPMKPGIVILTALPVEYQAVRVHLLNPHELTTENLNGEHGLFVEGETSWDIFLIETGQGNSAAGGIAERAVHYFKPAYIFLVGVAGGLKNTQMGDVVIAEYVYPYTSGKAGTDFQARPHSLISTPRLIGKARRETNKADWHKRILPSPPATPPQAFVAPIASGDQVIVSTSSDTYKLLSTHFEDAKAVEMEGYGFLHTMKDHTTIGAIVIRGISDRLDNKAEIDKQFYQPQAASHASAFAFELIANLDDPQTSFVKEPPPDSSANLNHPHTSPTRESSPGPDILQESVPSPETTSPHKAETPVLSREDAVSFFARLQECRQKIVTFFVFLDNEPIYSDDCTEAIKIISDLYEDIQKTQHAFAVNPGIQFGLSNLSNSANALKNKLQNLRRLCISSAGRNSAERKQYKIICETIRQGRTDLLRHLNDLQNH